MKTAMKLALLFCIGMAAGAVFAQTPTKVVFTWVSGNTGTGALATCPATSPTNCVTGWTIAMDGTTIVGPSTLTPAILTYTQTPLPAVGSHSYSLVMNGFDQNGKAITSAAVTTSVTIAAPPPPTTIPAPTGFKVTLQ